MCIFDRKIGRQEVVIALLSISFRVNSYYNGWVKFEFNDTYNDAMMVYHYNHNNIRKTIMSGNSLPTYNTNNIFHTFFRYSY